MISVAGSPLAFMGYAQQTPTTVSASMKKRMTYKAQRQSMHHGSFSGAPGSGSGGVAATGLAGPDIVFGFGNQAFSPGSPSGIYKKSL